MRQDDIDRYYINPYLFASFAVNHVFDSFIISIPRISFATFCIFQPP